MNAIRLIKRGWRRACVFALILCMLLPVLCACDGDTNHETPTDTAAAGSGVTLNGVPLEQYEIRYAWRDANKEHDQAKLIQKAIKDTFGVSLKLGEDSDERGQYVIMVGDQDQGTVTSKTAALGDTDYVLTHDDTTVYLLAKSIYGMQQVGALFCAQITSASESKAISVSKGSTISFADKIVNTMTFNIRCWSFSEAHLSRIFATIKNAEYPDTIGFQEMGKKGSWVWVDKLMARTEISSVYGWVGEDRGDSTGERAAIFYRKDKYRLVESGTKWMYGDDLLGSDTPGSVNVPHTDGDYYRVYTYLVLERISDGVKLVHINTHLDTASYYEIKDKTTGEVIQSIAVGYEVQTQQLSYALAMAKKLQTQYDCTVVFTGDFNTTFASAPFNSITSAGFVWTEQIAKKKTGSEVDDIYAEESIPICKGIDHIFIMDDNPYCLSYNICNKKITYRGVEDYASDHLARYAAYIVD